MGHTPPRLHGPLIGLSPPAPSLCGGALLMAVWLDLERSAALFVVAVISGGREDSAGRGRRRLEVHYRPREELSALANEMLDLFVFPPDAPQMSHPARRRRHISGANYVCNCQLAAANESDSEERRR